MQGVLHYSALKAGVAFLPFAAGIIAAAGASSGLVPRIGPRIPMTLGLGVGALGLAWLTQIGVGTSYWTHVLPPEILMSVGLGLAFPALSSTALVNVGDRDSGVASALVNTAQQAVGRWGPPCSTPWRPRPPPPTSRPMGRRWPAPGRSTATRWPSPSEPACSPSGPL